MNGIVRAVFLAAMSSIFVLLTGCGPFGGSTTTQPPGTIVFGSGISRVSAYQFVVKHPHPSFKDGQVIGWVAQLSRAIGKAPVTVDVIDVASKQTLYRAQLVTVKASWVQLAKSAPVDAFVKAGTRGPVPGQYTLEYVQGSTVLAKGTFRIRR